MSPSASAISGEVDALKARRDFLEADVEQLELFLTEQRNRLREAATSIVDITERVPGGLGEARPPLLSASDDESDDTRAADVVDDIAVDHVEFEESSDDELVIVADIAESETPEHGMPAVEDPWGDLADEPTQAMPVIDTVRADRDEDDFRFSFDDDRN